MGGVKNSKKMAMTNGDDKCGVVQFLVKRNIVTSSLSYRQSVIRFLATDQTGTRVAAGHRRVTQTVKGELVKF